LASWSRKANFGANTGLNTSESCVATNDRMPFYAFERLVKVSGDVRGKIVAMLGVSYRGDVGDTRFSPVNLFVTCLEEAGATVVCHDPFVAFWPERNISVEQNITAVLAARPSIVVISAGHKQYMLDETISILLTCTPMIIFDTIGLLTATQIVILSRHHKISILGRGDI
jgi:UDP-N-acetyl-D-glucosamine dehydrogenase